MQFTVPTGYCQTLGGSSSENLDAAAAIAKIGVTGSEVASGLIGARLKARGLQAGQLLSKRADFSCMASLHSPLSFPPQLRLSASSRNDSSSASLTVDVVCRYQRRELLHC